MKIWTEFAVLHDDVPMPDEEAFCPSFWKADDFDSDGDFYATGLGGRWSDLRLTKRVPGGIDSRLTVQVLRGTVAHPGALPIPAGSVATTLSIETADLDDYREFLRTVEMFLGHTGGLMIVPWERDRESFAAEFLGP